MIRRSFASMTPAWRRVLAVLVVAFASSQLLDLVTAQGLSSVEPRGAFAETNPILAMVADPVMRQFVGILLKIALTILVVWVALVQRRRLVGAIVLIIGTAAGLLGAWTNVHPWWFA